MLYWKYRLVEAKEVGKRERRTIIIDDIEGDMEVYVHILSLGLGNRKLRPKFDS